MQITKREFLKRLGLGGAALAGGGLLAYILAAIIMPSEGRPEE